MSGSHSVGAQPERISVEHARVDQPGADRSVGELLGELAGDLSKLMRQEVELAKAEVRQEATKAGKAAGMYGAAGAAGYFAVLFLSLTLMWAIGEATDRVWLGALVVTLVWAVVGAVLYSRAKRQMASVTPKPQQTIDTLKEDAEWVRTRSS